MAAADDSFDQVRDSTGELCLDVLHFLLIFIQYLVLHLFLAIKLSANHLCTHPLPINLGESIGNKGFWVEQNASHGLDSNEKALKFSSNYQEKPLGLNLGGLPKSVETNEMATGRLFHTGLYFSVCFAFWLTAFFYTALEFTFQLLHISSQSLHSAFIPSMQYDFLFFFLLIFSV